MTDRSPDKLFPHPDVFDQKRGLGINLFSRQMLYLVLATMLVTLLMAAPGINSYILFVEFIEKLSQIRLNRVEEGISIYCISGTLRVRVAFNVVATAK